MDCPNCGATVQPGINRCAKCGSYVEQQQPSPATPPEPAAVPATAYVQSEPHVPKSRLVAGLLGIFLGGLGVHRFYLGHTGIGVAQLLLTILGSWFTCGVSAVAAGIWGLTEGILLLVGVIDRDADGYPLES